jgi:sec-independent protein translocase protein TatA
MNELSHCMAFMMPSTQELLIVAAVLILFFGAARIPQLMRGFGQGIREFRKGMDGAPDASETSKSTK